MHEWPCEENLDPGLTNDAGDFHMCNQTVFVTAIPRDCSAGWCGECYHETSEVNHMRDIGRGNNSLTNSITEAIILCGMQYLIFSVDDSVERSTAE